MSRVVEYLPEDDLIQLSEVTNNHIIIFKARGSGHKLKLCKSPKPRYFWSNIAITNGTYQFAEYMNIAEAMEAVIDKGTVHAFKSFREYIVYCYDNSQF